MDNGLNVGGRSIRNWLKEKGMPKSGNIIERIESLIQDKKLQERDVLALIEELKENGRKHIFLFSISDPNWLKLESATKIQTYFDQYLSKFPDKQIFSMNHELSRIENNSILVRMTKYIRVPRIQKDKKITIEGQDWAAIIYENVPVSIIFIVNFNDKSIEIRFDSIAEMGAEKKEILRKGKDFLKDAFGIEGLSTKSLYGLAQKLEESTFATIYDFYARVETSNQDGDIVSGVVRVSRDETSLGAASDLPTGKELLKNDNEDVLLDTYGVVWNHKESGDVITRNFNTTIYTSTGEIHFKSFVNKKELDYVLSNIRRLA